MPRHTKTNRGGNGGAGAGGRRSKKSAGGKELSKAALRSIVKNEESAEEFLSALARGEKPPSFELAKVEKALGGGRFEVMSPETGPVRATLEGLFVGRGDFWKNPEVSTAVRPGGYVVVEDIGLGHMAAGGHHRIVAILDGEQSRRALRMLGRRGSTRSSSRRSSNSGGFAFNRGEQNVAAAAARGEEVGAAGAALASMRRHATRRRTSSGKTARSSESNVSSDPNWSKLSEERKAEAKHAKLTRRKERRRAKKAGGSAWSWFSF